MKGKIVLIWSLSISALCEPDQKIRCQTFLWTNNRLFSNNFPILPQKNLQTIERFELLGVPSSNILIISFIVGICAELITQTFKLSIKTRSTVGNAKASLADLHASATDQYLCQICILKLQNSKTDLQKMPFASLCLSPSFFLESFPHDELLKRVKCSQFSLDFRFCHDFSNLFLFKKADIFFFKGITLSAPPSPGRNNAKIR